MTFGPFSKSATNEPSITTKLNTIFKVENKIENLKDFVNKQ